MFKLMQLLFLAYLTLENQCCIYEGTDFLLLLAQVEAPDVFLAHTIYVLGNSQTSVKLRLSWEEQDVVQIIGQDSVTTFSVTDTNSQLNFHNYDPHHGVVNIVATDPVVVYVHVNKGDGYTGIPRSEMDVMEEYITASYQVDPNCETYVAVAAHEDNTSVTVSVRVRNDGTAHNKNDNRGDMEMYENISLSRHEVLLIWSHDDLTGTSVRSDGKIAVFSGVTCASVPVNGPDKQAFLDQFPPVSVLTRSVLSVPVHSRTIFRQITTNGPMTTEDGVSQQTHIHTGDFTEFELGPPYFSNITGNSTILVYQYLRSEILDDTIWPVTTMQLPQQSYETGYRFVALPNFDTQLSIIHPVMHSGVYVLVLNNTRLEITSVEDLGNDYVSILIPVTEGGYSITSEDPNVKMVVYVFGYSSYSAVGFVAACARLSPQVTATSSLNTRSYGRPTASADPTSITSSQIQPRPDISTTHGFHAFTPYIVISEASSISKVSIMSEFAFLSEIPIMSDVSIVSKIPTMSDDAIMSEVSIVSEIPTMSDGVIMSEVSIVSEIPTLSDGAIMSKVSSEIMSELSSGSQHDMWVESESLEYSTQRAVRSHFQEMTSAKVNKIISEPSDVLKTSGFTASLSVNGKPIPTRALSNMPSTKQFSNSAFNYHNDISPSTRDMPTVSSHHGIIGSSQNEVMSSLRMSATLLEEAAQFSVQTVVSPSPHAHYLYHYPDLSAKNSIVSSPTLSATSSAQFLSQQLSLYSIHPTSVPPPRETSVNNSLLSSLAASNLVLSSDITESYSLSVSMLTAVPHSLTSSMVTMETYTSVQSTVTSGQRSTRSPPILCSCPWAHRDGLNDTDLKMKLLRTKLNIAVNKDLLSSSRRKRTSAEDKRSVVKIIGTGTIVFVLLPFLCIIVMDVKSMYDDNRRTRH